MNKLPQLVMGIAFAAIFMASCGAPTPENTVVGNWNSFPPTGEELLWKFRADQSVGLLIDGKVFASGTYRVDGDTLFVSDPVCGADYFGSYLLGFVPSNAVQLTGLQDTCRGRNAAMDGLELIRKR